ncbi:MAG TPA: hypothetical protein VK112_13130 [Fodinibius sp.]|nr:hypothetical protein [Fodinibius sp.]
MQSRLAGILKRKAVGPRGSRHLNEDDLEVIIPALQAGAVNRTAKAVLVTAVIIQERNELEDSLLKGWKSGEYFLPDELSSFFFEAGHPGFPKMLHQVLRGEDLSPRHASAAISHLLDGGIPDYQKGVFLIGERLKRESFEENRAFLRQLRIAVNSQQVDVPLLIDLADPYDGFRRYPIYTPFVAALLAAMEIPTYCHGLQKVAPKYGDTIHRVLDLADKNPGKSAADVARDIEDESIGWGYIDQSVCFPATYDLLGLRDKMVKRSFLATLEKLLQPLRSRQINYMVAGYVHSHYQQDLANLLKSKKALDRVLIVKGMEGTSQLDFRKEPDHIMVHNGKSLAVDIESEKIGYSKAEWEECNSMAEYVLETGIAALNGSKNIARQILINQAVQITGSLDILEPIDAQAVASRMLDSGQALRHWKRGCN